MLLYVYSWSSVKPPLLLCQLRLQKPEIKVQAYS